MKPRILVIDDEVDMLRLLKRSLEPDLGCRVEIADSGESGLGHLSRQSFHLILMDIKMPGMDGLELLELIKKDHPDQTVVMMTAHGRIETAVQAMKIGAHDFITKPFDHATLIVKLEKALERSNLLRENLRLQKKYLDQDMFQGLVGTSAVITRAYEAIQTVAQTDLTVLITGESGTGKDLAARAIHALSQRNQKSYVVVNCPAVPEHILESELFEYKKGAFTHAVQNKIGLFQEAHNGSIFLDEIGDISPTIQTKLLRVLQEKEIKPLGDTKSITVDVRIIASTNQDLQKKISHGEYREDFFYRLNVVPIKMPALREHPEDIPLIANHLLEKHRMKLNNPGKTISSELMGVFMGRPWEGNVREMENTIIRGILFSADDQIRVTDLERVEATDKPAAAKKNAVGELPYKAAKAEILKRFNNHYIGEKLSVSNGNVTQAAKDCGMERQALQQVMRRYGISAEPHRD
jgi:DNA-binding NtrC family response regulator